MYGDDFCGKYLVTFEAKHLVDVKRNKIWRRDWDWYSEKKWQKPRDEVKLTEVSSSSFHDDGLGSCAWELQTANKRECASNARSQDKISYWALDLVDTRRWTRTNWLVRVITAQAQNHQLSYRILVRERPDQSKPHGRERNARGAVHGNISL